MHDGKQIGAAELNFRYKLREADASLHGDNGDETPADFGSDKTEFPQKLHHVFVKWHEDTTDGHTCSWRVVYDDDINININYYRLSNTH